MLGAVLVGACVDPGLPPLPPVDPSIRGFSIGPFTTSHYTGDDEFSINLNLDGPDDVTIEAVIPDGTDITQIEVTIDVPAGVVLIVSDPTNPPIEYASRVTRTPFDFTNPVTFTTKNQNIEKSRTIKLTRVSNISPDVIPIFGEQNFAYVRKNLGENYILVNDIKLIRNFEPIAPHVRAQNQTSSDYSGTPFTGDFDGGGKTISGVRILKQGEDNVGFFGQIGAGGKVHNLILALAMGSIANPSIEGKTNMGALAGNNIGTIEEVGIKGGYVRGSEDTVGGLVGLNHQGGSIERSYATAIVEGIGINVGGLVGENSTDFADFNIKDSYATGAVKANGAVGGLVGFNQNGKIERSYSIGKVEGSGAGGLVGFNNGTLRDSYFDATLSDQGQIVSDDQGTTESSRPFHTVGDFVYRNKDNISDTTKVTMDDFDRWDFIGRDNDGPENIWDMPEAGLWPILAWQQ